MGTWGMGGRAEKDSSNDTQSIAALQSGLDMGINLIDTAEFYGAGHTEELVGKAISGRRRENLFLISKVWKTNLRHNDLLAAAKRSLDRLNTDYLDLYIIHWPNEEIPLQETMGALETLVGQKLVRTIGISNFSLELINEASRHLKNIQLAANQIEYNLLHQEAAETIIPYCLKNNLHIIAYRPLARGDLTKTHTEILSKLAEKYQKTANQIALNWLISQNITVIPKSTNKEHLKENMGALGWNLSKEDIEALRALPLK